MAIVDHLCIQNQPDCLKNVVHHAVKGEEALGKGDEIVQEGRAQIPPQQLLDRQQAMVDHVPVLCQGVVALPRSPAHVQPPNPFQTQGSWNARKKRPD